MFEEIEKRAKSGFSDQAIEDIQWLISRVKELENQLVDQCKTTCKVEMERVEIGGRD